MSIDFINSASKEKLKGFVDSGIFRYLYGKKLDFQYYFGIGKEEFFHNIQASGTTIVVDETIRKEYEANTKNLKNLAKFVDQYRRLCLYVLENHYETDSDKKEIEIEINQTHTALMTRLDLKDFLDESALANSSEDLMVELTSKTTDFRKQILKVLKNYPAGDPEKMKAALDMIETIPDIVTQAAFPESTPKPENKQQKRTPTCNMG